jgi:hypothetical protein
MQHVTLSAFSLNLKSLAIIENSCSKCGRMIRLLCWDIACFANIIKMFFINHLLITIFGENSTFWMIEGFFLLCGK